MAQLTIEQIKEILTDTKNFSYMVDGIESDTDIIYDFNDILPSEYTNPQDVIYLPEHHLLILTIDQFNTYLKGLTGVIVNEYTQPKLLKGHIDMGLLLEHCKTDYKFANELIQFYNNRNYADSEQNNSMKFQWEKTGLPTNGNYYIVMEEPW